MNSHPTTFDPQPATPPQAAPPYPFLDKPVAITQQQWLDDVPPLVSISCTTYNHENYIRDAIEGFLMQETTFRVEILIYEDCSTDRTAEIIKSYEQQHPQLFRCLYQPENTYSKPNRRELRRPFFDMRRGKYLASCEGDDFWTDPQKLQLQVEVLEEDPSCTVVFHDVDLLFEDGLAPIPPYKLDEQREVWTLQDILGANFIVTCSVLYRRFPFESWPEWLQTWNGPMGDWPLFVFLLQKGNGMYLDRQMATYRLSNQGVWTSSDRSRRMDHFLAFHTRMARIMPFPENRISRRQASTFYLSKAGLPQTESFPSMALFIKAFAILDWRDWGHHWRFRLRTLLKILLKFVGAGPRRSLAF